VSDQDQTTQSILAGLGLFAFLVVVGFVAAGLILMAKECGWHP